MASSTEIANRALGHLGIGQNIGNLDTSKGADAEACRDFFDIAANDLQRDLPFAFSTKRQLLGLITEEPNDEYNYEYQYPSDCIFAGRINSARITDTEQSAVHYKIMRGSSGKVIWTNCEDAELEYQFLETDSSRYDVDFVLTLSYHLAGLIAPLLTGGDPFGLGQKATDNYEAQRRKAFANALNEQQEEPRPQSEFIAAREGEFLFNRGIDWTAFPDNRDIL